MSKPTAFLIQCGDCEEVFAIEVVFEDVSEDEDGVKSIEKPCTHCKELQHIVLPGTLGNDTSMLKGIKPPRK